MPVEESGSTETCSGPTGEKLLAGGLCADKKQCCFSTRFPLSGIHGHAGLSLAKLLTHQHGLISCMGRFTSLLTRNSHTTCTRPIQTQALIHFHVHIVEHINVWCLCSRKLFGKQNSTLQSNAEGSLFQTIICLFI